ncbi:MAG TPA: SgcJ/EcaC family oxidoreductase [Planctomycetaceae bacterium]|nr:SgcJ/EcaC family oxidoreductase [Planctomycetaceae bacterium]
MKRVFLPLGSIVAIAAVCFVAADEKQKPAGAGQAAKTPAKSGAKTAPAKAAPAEAPPAAAPKASPEEQTARLIGQTLVKIYNQRDGKAFSALFTPDGEYVDEKGFVFHGRKAIEDEFTAFFKSNPETTIDVELTSMRSIAAGLLAADGATHFRRAKSEPAVVGRCSFVAAKDGAKWLIASLREVEAAGNQLSHHEQVQQLSWLIGEWIDEGSSSHVHFSCRWDESQNFLLRDFAVHVAGQKAITGTQRIGYDPITGHLKTWIFDSGGGYGDGYFHREGDSWVLHTSGVTSDGRMASGTNIFTRIDDHRMSWEGVDRVVGGERVPDIVKVTIVRKPPTPMAKAK